MENTIRSIFKAKRLLEFTYSWVFVCDWSIWNVNKRSKCQEHWSKVCFKRVWIYMPQGMFFHCTKDLCTHKMWLAYSKVFLKLAHVERDADVSGRLSSESGNEISELLRRKSSRVKGGFWKAHVWIEMEPTNKYNIWFGKHVSDHCKIISYLYKSWINLRSRKMPSKVIFRNKQFSLRKCKYSNT